MKKGHRCVFASWPRRFPNHEIANIVLHAFEANLLLEAKKSNAQSIGDGDNPEKHGCDLAEMQFPKKEPHCTLPNLRESGYRRTSLRGSFAVMGGMLVFWLATALIFLRMRDIQ